MQQLALEPSLRRLFVRAARQLTLARTGQPFNIEHLVLQFAHYTENVHDLASQRAGDHPERDQSRQHLQPGLDPPEVVDPTTQQDIDSPTPPSQHLGQRLTVPPTSSAVKQDSLIAIHRRH